MELNPSWWAASFAATQEFPNVFPKKSKSEARCDIRLNKQTIKIGLYFMKFLKILKNYILRVDLTWRL
jgi:hypothetical protein